jgi:heavy metal translocating P-type ATPase
MSVFDSCDLCGLTIRGRGVSYNLSGTSFRFCCMGCKQVFQMLSEASDQADPASFKETGLFKKCRDLGIIPRSEDELEQTEQASPSVTNSLYTTSYDDETSTKVRDKDILSLNLRIEQMWCPACAWIIEEAVKKSPGVLDAGCNFSTDRLRCEYDPVRTSPSQIIQTIDHLGYRASLPGEEWGAKEKRREFIRFVISAFLTVNVMMFSYSLYSGFFTALDRETVRGLSWPIFVMAGVVLFYGGRNIYRRAFVGLSTAAFSMETLITIGAFSAYLYSTFKLFSGSIHLYFDSASMLITLVLLGKILEGRAKGEVQEGLANFFSLLPTKVKLCTKANPQGRYVSIQQLRKGDIFTVAEGETFSADGLVIEGSGAVDESSITGEALPIEKKPGDRVRSGSRVIQGMLKVRAEGVGEESTLGQMIQIMEKALSGKTRLEGSTDRLLRWFVPIILILSAGTAAGCLLAGLSYDNALLRAITIMVIACPCSLGIAIPLARVAGVSLGGRLGLLVRDFSSFERAETINTLVLDKTGTVTEGKWTLQDIIPYPPFTKERILSLALSMETVSDHYIAHEIRRAAERRGIRPVQVEKIKAFETGLSGWIENNEVKIGSKSFFSEELKTSGVSPSKEIPDNKSKHSFVFMSFGGKPCGVLVFGDRIKRNAFSTINQLRDLGYRLVLVSGDGEITTRAVGEKIGIRETYGEKIPQEKAALIEALQEMGKNRVAMIGDGINDAPALVQADLAVAVYSGSHLGKEAADITLMRGDPSQILDFLDLARRVKKKVFQNLIFSFSYNVVSIPIAMSGLLNPLIAVSAMLLSSLSVIGNTLLLIKKGPKPDKRTAGKDSSDITYKIAA